MFINSLLAKFNEDAIYKRLISKILYNIYVECRVKNQVNLLSLTHGDLTKNNYPECLRLIKLYQKYLYIENMVNNKQYSTKDPVIPNTSETVRKINNWINSERIAQEFKSHSDPTKKFISLSKYNEEGRVKIVKKFIIDTNLHKILESMEQGCYIGYRDNLIFTYKINLIKKIKEHTGMNNIELLHKILSHEQIQCSNKGCEKYVGKLNRLYEFDEDLFWVSKTDKKKLTETNLNLKKSYTTKYKILKEKWNYTTNYIPYIKITCGAPQCKLSVKQYFYFSEGFKKILDALY